MQRRPDFSAIDTTKIESQLDDILARSRTRLAELEFIQNPSWENFVQPQEELDNELSLFWSPISHLNSVLNSDELREAHNACLPKIREYSTEASQNVRLFELTQQLRDSKDYESLSTAQKKIIENALPSTWMKSSQIFIQNL